MLAPVDGAVVPAGRLRVQLGPKIVGSRHFRLLVDPGTGDAPRPFVHGLYATGPYPGNNWAELFDIDIPAELAGAAGWEVGLAAYLAPLAETIPAGGHLMIEYEKDAWRETQVGLLAGIPPLATPMGALLFELGAAASIKDWYFPEGGAEGGRKLQGNKPLSAAHAVESGAARAAELRAFLAAAPQGDRGAWERARVEAGRILDRLAEAAAR